MKILGQLRLEQISFPEDFDQIQLQNQVSTHTQGPVVQSIVSLTSSLRGQLVKCFVTL